MAACSKYLGYHPERSKITVAVTVLLHKGYSFGAKFVQFVLEDV
jgi:hypothetical protein